LTAIESGRTVALKHWSATEGEITVYEFPVAAYFAADAVRRQFDPSAPAEPDRPPRAFRPVRRVRSVTAAALQRVAEAVEPRPECSPVR
jgi:hypothetical protein